MDDESPKSNRHRWLICTHTLWRNVCYLPTYVACFVISWWWSIQISPLSNSIPFRIPWPKPAKPLLLRSATMPSSTNTIHSTTMIGRSKPPNTLQAPAIPSPNRPHLSLRRILVNKRRRLVSTERRRELQVAWLFRNSPPPSSSDAKRSWSARRPIWSEGKRSCAMPERKHGATIGHRCRRNTVRLRVSIRTLTWKSRRSSRKSCANCTICGCVSCEDLFNKWIGTKVWNIIIYLHI